MAQSGKYTPGVCNINRHEIFIRKMVGWLGVAIFVIWLAILLVFELPRWWHLVLFLPAFIAANGFLQAKNHFCVGYARSNVQKASDSAKLVTKLTNLSHISKDKSKARQINLQSLAIALVVALACLLIPASI